MCAEKYCSQLTDILGTKVLIVTGLWCGVFTGCVLTMWVPGLKLTAPKVGSDSELPPRLVLAAPPNSSVTQHHHRPVGKLLGGFARCLVTTQSHQPSKKDYSRDGTHCITHYIQLTSDCISPSNINAISVSTLILSYLIPAPSTTLVSNRPCSRQTRTE